MSFKFGRSSTEKLETAHKDLQLIFNLAIRRSKVDFGITEGYRSIERQKMLYDQGKSRIDGIIRKGKHNYNPSQAVDYYIYHPNLELRRRLAYDKVSLAYVAGLLDSCAEELYDKGQISHKLRWGANWDMDGVIDLDQSFDDYPHVEIIKP